MAMTEKAKANMDKVDAAFALLAEVGMTGTAVDQFRMAAMKAAMEAGDPGWSTRVHCYLMFFGSGTTATHVKIGISNDPKLRIAGVRTGNPLEPLWVYSFPYSDRVAAGSAERFLHSSFPAKRSNGEWFTIEPAGEAEARALANGAYRMAADHRTPCGQLERVEF